MKNTKWFLKNLMGKSFLLLFIALLHITSCGKTSVSIDKSTYEPKIVIAGLLYPEKPISNIKITRNFSVGAEIDKNDISLQNANASITDVKSGVKYLLSYNQDSAYFEYLNSDLQIFYDNSYRLDVSATIDGINLTASSTTTVPSKGMTIVQDSSIFGRMIYRQKTVDGNLIMPTIAYLQSDNTAFYLVSISGREANTENFIYENPFGMDINKPLDNGADIEQFQYQFTSDMRYNSENDLAKIEINWFQIWFYTEYRLILYATDQNYYHFFVTHQSVQEIDGNLHEPVFDIEGEGIGYFGSAITDTLYLEILKKQ